MEEKEMKEKENKLAIFQSEGRQAYTSIVTDTPEEKKKLFNALENCDVLLNDCVGQEISIKDIYIEKRNVTDEETGEIKPKFRTILFDVKGQTYATGSYGIYNVIAKIVGIYGEPSTWKEPIKVQVAKRPIGNGKQSLTLKLL